MIESKFGVEFGRLWIEVIFDNRSFKSTICCSLDCCAFICPVRVFKLEFKPLRVTELTTQNIPTPITKARKAPIAMTPSALMVFNKFPRSLLTDNSGGSRLTLTGIIVIALKQVP